MCLVTVETKIVGYIIQENSELTEYWRRAAQTSIRIMQDWNVPSV